MSDLLQSVSDSINKLNGTADRLVKGLSLVLEKTPSILGHLPLLT
jgi:hypothetical protein